MSTTDQNGSSRTPDEIRAEIERTRAGLSYDVDALADKVNPSSIAHRQTEKVKSRFSGVKESVMGAAHDAASTTQGAGHDAAGSVSDASSAAVRKAKGNPLAVGLIAFGAGWLVSSLIPATDKEKELVSDAKDAAGPALDSVKGAAQDVVSNLKEPAQEAFASVKGTAQDAASTVKDDASSAAGDVKDSAQQSKENVQGA
jgi:hypothetical protein